METKTKLAAGVATAVFLVFMIVLAGDFLFEEQIIIFLLPFVPVGIFLAARYIVARIRKRPVPLERRVRRLLYAGSLFNCLVIAAYLYCTLPRSYIRTDAVEDIDSFVKTLEDVHPNLYDLVSKEEFANSVGALKGKIPASIGEHELFMGIARLGSLVRDAHTGNGYSYFTRRGNFLLRRIFPYKIRVENDRIFVAGTYSYCDDIPAGSEVIRINGLTPPEFIRQVGAIVSYETIPLRNMLIANPLFISFWDDFREYGIEYRAPGSNASRSVTTAGGLYARIRFLRSLTALREPYEFRVVADSIGYVGFYRCDDPERFDGFLRETFATVKKKGIGHVIVDIRENGGGNSYLGDQLMQYISRKPFRMFDRILVKVSGEVLSRYPERIDSAERKAGTTYASGEIPMTPLEENPLRFTGQCILITGRNTFSSAAAFACAFRCFDAGVIVGAETGGITVCYGDVYDFRLPHTGFGFGVSWKKFANACGVDNRRGLIPDYVLDGDGPKDASGVDTVLQFAIGLAKQPGKERLSRTF